MQPDDVADFISDFTVEWNKLQAEASAQAGSRQRELDAVKRKLDTLIDAIADGLRAPGLQQKLDDLEGRKRVLEREVVAVPAPQPALHPTLAEVYRAKGADLNAALHDATDGTAALEAARSLIETVVLSPGSDGAGLEIELTGEIAAMLDLALNSKNGSKRGFAAGDPDLFARSVKVVAGKRNHRQLTPFRVAC